MSDSTAAEHLDLADFATKAQTWVEQNKHKAPPDYGAIVPHRLLDRGIAWQRRLFEAGWAGIHWPTEHGGQGLSSEHQSVWLEVCARAEVPAFINMVGFVLAGQGLQIYGTADQQQRHLRSIITAEQIWCQLFSEPEAGSDLASLQTAAVRDGDEWVVNGHKVWCSGGRHSDWGILMARTNTDVSKHSGISFFVVDMHSAGIEVRPIRQMNGGSEFDEVFFDNVCMPADALLGELDDGWRVGMTILTNERGSIGAAAISTERRLDALAGMADGDLGVVERQRLATLVSQGRAYSYMGARQGPGASIGSSLNKLGITELSFAAAELKADIAGADAMLAGPGSDPILGAPGGRIAGGSSQIQRNIIGERILGLPKEPR